MCFVSCYPQLTTRMNVWMGSALNKILIIVLYLIQINLYFNIYLRLSFYVNAKPNWGFSIHLISTLQNKWQSIIKISFLIVCFCQIYFLFLCSCLTIEIIVFIWIHNIIWCKTISHISFFITCSISCKIKNVCPVNKRLFTGVTFWYAPILQYT